MKTKEKKELYQLGFEFDNLGLNHRINDLPAMDTPVKRVLMDPLICSTIELLSVLIGGQQQFDLARTMLERFGGLEGVLRSSNANLTTVKGVTELMVARIKAGFALNGRLDFEKQSQCPLISSPGALADLIKYDMSALDHEELWVAILNTRNKLIKIVHLYVGSSNSSTVRVAEIFREATVMNAASIILVHNHPSGEPSPSPEDISLTRAVVSAGKLFDIALLDHLVIGGGKYKSLKEAGLGF